MFAAVTSASQLLRDPDQLHSLEGSQLLVCAVRLRCQGQTWSSLDTPVASVTATRVASG
jgi:hypothetical protein